MQRDENSLGPAEFKNLLRKIRKESANLTSVMWTREELLENQYQLNMFQQRIRQVMNEVTRNLYWYQKIGWKKFEPNAEEWELKEREKGVLKEKERLAEWVKEFMPIQNQIDVSLLAGKLSHYAQDELKSSHVLDIGCGDGRWLRKLTEWGALPEQLTGIDISKPMLESAESLSAPGIRFIHAFPDELPMEEGKFNLILMFGFLVHVLDESLRIRIGQEMLRLLSKDGILITANLLKGAERELEPYLAYTTKGLSADDLTEIFPDCQIDFEELPPYGLAVIRKNSFSGKGEVASEG